MTLRELLWRDLEGNAKLIAEFRSLAPNALDQEVPEEQMFNVSVAVRDVRQGRSAPHSEVAYIVGLMSGLYED